VTSERRRPALPGFERIGWLALVSPDMNPRVHDQTLCLDGSWTTETSVRFESDALVYRSGGERPAPDKPWPVRARSIDHDVVARVLAYQFVGDIRRGLRTLDSTAAKAIAEQRVGRVEAGWPSRLPRGWSVSSAGVLLHGDEAVADAEQACSELALAAWTCGIEPDALLAFLLTGDTTVSAEKLRESVDAFVRRIPGFDRAGGEGL